MIILAAYLGTHGDLHSIRQLFHALQHGGASLHAEADVLAGEAPIPLIGL